MSEWEKADSIPPPLTRGGSGIELEPGQIIRRAFTNSRQTAGNYTASFKRTGRTDYHAARRTVDGQAYIYIWRDPEAL